MSLYHKADDERDADTVRAIRLFAEEKGMKYDRLASTIQVEIEPFMERLENTAQRAEALAVRGHAPQPKRGQHSFTRNELKRMTKELGFETPEDMIFEAQEKFEMPENQRWKKYLTTKPKGLPEASNNDGQGEKPRHLKKYIASINLLISKTDKASGQYIQQIMVDNCIPGNSSRNMAAFLDGKYIKMSEPQQMELVRQFCSLLAVEPEINQPGMTPEGMLAFTRKSFPQTVKVEKSLMFKHDKKGHMGYF